MSDRIEKSIALKAPVSRVRLDGAFVPARVSRGRVTDPGYERLRWETLVRKMEPAPLFSFTCHLYDIDPNEDCSGAPPTPVAFTLRGGRNRAACRRAGL